ncbi:MAG: Addiction module antitoxin, RelB/DinJ family [Candidatus Woesebacteria bacterium GW2011_GWA1_37_8]|uniref:Addiction module antitoxin, RelB/DinJ family n=2 Tax=Candidatus Woeseibacteriota TaxID=1752722 RepID=A0A0G0KZ89_9BACT|nr:MAG: Addiction module antitoxin, RelB/DinJ family [Microgenomates group bacterium GW2011_GWC1_37_12b]KKQ45786.1 MAG: Addiction module antitoxin, RelB/DinJ family [Candidatus Woesebacteria bacterium GW2011_GWA1_37_8]
MNTAVINIKTNAKVKSQAQKIASDLGFSLSSLINGYLNQLIKTKTIHFSLTEEIPSEYMIQALKESEEDRKAGRVSPSFDNVKDAIDWLNNPKRRYLNES